MISTRCQVIFNRDTVMIQWLYRYIFRGLGIVFLIGMLTILILAVGSQRERTAQPSSPTAGRTAVK